jgi:alkylation response protein AidB-like acyl-CoA dehydrogenase
MDFALNDTQTALQDMLRRLLADAGGGPELGASGVFAALVPERFGGIAGAGVEAMIVAEEFGRAGRENHFVETGVLASLLIDRLGTEEQRSAWLPKIAAGDLVIPFIGPEHGLQFEGGAEAPLLSGSAAVVPYGGACDLLIAAAGSVEDGSLALFLLDPDARGKETARFVSIDGARSAALAFDRARAQPLAPGDTAAALAEVVDRAIVAQSAERIGLMAGLINATLEQLRTRKQFGSLLGDFQALQHRLADMFIAYELARSSVLKAALVEADGERRPRAAAAAKYLSARSARLVGYEAVQMHGAMGMTEELGLGRFVRRIAALDARLGTPAQHLQRLARGRAHAIH